MIESLLDMENRVTAKRLVPVAVIDDPVDALPLAETLADAGLPVVEFPLRTSAALDGIRAIRETRPDILVGAGTLLTPEQVDAAVGAGAQFGVSPGLNEAVVAAARRHRWLLIPGILTPTEVERALGLGCRLLKFFPAEPAGGARLLQALAAPYEHTGARFIPLGGIRPSNLAAYLNIPTVAAVGGAWLCERAMVRARRWAEISALTREALSLIEPRS